MNEDQKFKGTVGVFSGRQARCIVGYADGNVCTVGEDEAEDDGGEDGGDVPESRARGGKRRRRLAAARRLFRGIAERGTDVVRTAPTTRLASSAARIVTSAARDNADIATLARLGVNPASSVEQIREAVGADVSDVAIDAYRWAMKGR